MKNEKNRIIIFILVSLILVLGVIKINFVKEDKDDEKVTDAIKFKKEYESLNDKKSGDMTYPKVTLNDKNPFVYKSAKDIVNTLKSGTGIIYLGFPKCPWCRNAVNILSYLNVDEIMYLNMTDQRDTYEVVDNILSKTKEGTKEYYEMLDILDDILTPYEIEENGITYDTKEKRIYVPLVIGVKNGKIVGYHADTVNLKEGQTPFDLLDNSQKEELKKVYDDIKEKVYGDTCDINDKGC